jgi:hypothetical protein
MVGPPRPLIDNDEVAAFVREYPDRLVGIASVDLTQPLAAVRELRRAVRELGFRGLRILPWLWNLPPDDRRYYPLYSECVELDIPFCLQVGHTGPLAPSEPERPIPYLDHVALEFPDLRIVGGHIGFPWTAEMISLATKYPNIYIDTSAYKVRRYPKELVDYLRAHGRRKVLFGSNYPAWPAKDGLEDFERLNLEEETAALFLMKTRHGSSRLAMREEAPRVIGAPRASPRVPRRAGEAHTTPTDIVQRTWAIPS